MWLDNAAHLMTKGFNEVHGVTHARMPMLLHELCPASCTQAAHTTSRLLKEAALNFACTCNGIVTVSGI